MTTAAQFEARVARLEKHLVPESAEEVLEKAERLFLDEGNSVWAQLALAGARLSHRLEK